MFQQINLLLLLLCIACINCNSAAEEEEQCNNVTGDQRQCGLYLARSTIPNAGLGVFTGIPHPFGASVAPPEIAHQIIVEGLGVRAGSYWHDGLGHEYTWSPVVTGGAFEGKDVQSLIPGLGMAANSFTVQVNARSIMGSIDSAGVNVNAPNDEENQNYIKGPGSGAFSSYHDMIYVAESPMEAGSEIFVDYGDKYFRERSWIYGEIPLAPEFHAADEMLETFWNSLPHRPLGEEWQSAWDALRERFVTDERVRNALPVSVKDISHAVDVGTPNYFLGGENPRSLDWLEENGLCMDHIDVGISGIPHAGRGAFAKRSFAPGAVIHPLPLMQIPRHGMNLYKNGDENKVIGKQLLLNYCFGHKDSSVLLFPYSSSSNFLNHGGKEANAKLVWADSSSDPLGWHDANTMKQSAEEISEHRTTSLLMLLVATEDIEVGDEVTIDYGTEWKQAWLRHVNSWPLETEKTASEYNESEEKINTIFEESYPLTVGTACHFQLDPYWFEGYSSLFHIDDRSKVPYDLDTALHIEYDDEDLDKLKSKLSKIEQHAYSWHESGNRFMSGEHLQPCTIISRHSSASEGEVGDDMYTVRVYLQESVEENHGPHSQTELYVKNLPRRAIIFVDRAGTSDQHHRKAFRHEIGFPDADAIWPSAWKDKEITW